MDPDQVAAIGSSCERAAVGAEPFDVGSEEKGYSSGVHGRRMPLHPGGASAFARACG
jgi:hypothetical protein